jgi:hypothetical protein
VSDGFVPFDDRMRPESVPDAPPFLACTELGTTGQFRDDRRRNALYGSRFG